MTPEASAASCSRREAVRPSRVNLANNRSEAFLLQALFHEGQNITVMGGLDIDDAIRMQTRPAAGRGRRGRAGSGTREPVP